MCLGHDARQGLPHTRSLVAHLTHIPTPTVAARPAAKAAEATHSLSLLSQHRCRKSRRLGHAPSAQTHTPPPTDTHTDGNGVAPLVHLLLSRAGQVSNHKSKSKFQSNKHRIVFNAVDFLSRAMSMRWIPREGGKEGWRRRRARKPCDGVGVRRTRWDGSTRAQIDGGLFFRYSA